MKEVNAVILQPDGDAQIEMIDPSNLGEKIGGWLEGIHPFRDLDAPHGNWFGYVDEEGKIKHLPINAMATILCSEMGWQGHGDTLCGTVILVGPPDANGDDTDLPDETLTYVLDFYRKHGTVDIQT